MNWKIKVYRMNVEFTWRNGYEEPWPTPYVACAEAGDDEKALVINAEGKSKEEALERVKAKIASR